MRAKLGSENDTSDESEDGSKRIENNQRDWDRDTLDKGSNEAVKHDEPAEDGDEDGKVDAR